MIKLYFSGALLKGCIKIVTAILLLFFDVGSLSKQPPFSNPEKNSVQNVLWVFFILNNSPISVENFSSCAIFSFYFFFFPEKEKKTDYYGKVGGDPSQMVVAPTGLAWEI